MALKWARAIQALQSSTLGPPKAEGATAAVTAALALEGAALRSKTPSSLPGRSVVDEERAAELPLVAEREDYDEEDGDGGKKRTTHCGPDQPKIEM